MAKCENCGSPQASLISSGYCRPIPDAAPTYSEWQELWLCAECEEDAKPVAKPVTVAGDARLEWHWDH